MTLDIRYVGHQQARGTPVLGLRTALGPIVAIFFVAFSSPAAAQTDLGSTGEGSQDADTQTGEPTDPAHTGLQPVTAAPTVESEPEPEPESSNRQPGALTTPPDSRRWHGFYIDFYGGLETHMDPDTVTVDLPEFNAETHTTSLFELDFGYTFEIGLSLGLGFELENFVAPNMKLDTKYSFMTTEQLQPYVYLCLHGGVVHLYPMAVHVGGGIDYLVSERVYLALDFRVGWEAVRADPELEQHLETAISMGFGFRLSGVEESQSP